MKIEYDVDGCEILSPYFFGDELGHLEWLCKRWETCFAWNEI